MPAGHCISEQIV